MSFCSQCGTKLPQQAVFCPNCGHSLYTHRGPKEASSQNPEPLGQAPGSESRTPLPMEQDFGYPPSLEGAQKKTAGTGHRTAILVISVSIVLLLFAVFLLLRPFFSTSFTGYWVNTAVDFGDGLREDAEHLGSLALQINRDKSAELYSEGKLIYRSAWEKEGKELLLHTKEGGPLLFEYRNRYLVLQTEGMTLYFTKQSGKSIFTPSLPPSPKSPSSIVGSGYVAQESYYISVNGAERFLDVDGDEALRVYYEFSNDNWAYLSASAWDALDFEARQDGETLSLTYSIDNEASDAAFLFIRPGVTIQASVEFKFKPSGGPVEMSFFGYEEGKAGGMVSASLLPESLPGAPPAYVAVPVYEPDWITDLESQGSLEDYDVSIHDTELVTDSNGDEAIRIYYAFSNHGTMNMSMDMALFTLAYQDGIELLPAYMEPSESDEAFYREIAPGDSATVSRVFLLRNPRSPVETEVQSYYEHSALGDVIYIN